MLRQVLEFRPLSARLYNLDAETRVPYRANEVRKRLKLISLRLAGFAALLVLFTYAGDYLSVRYKIPHGRDQFSNVTIQPYYAIHEKNGRTEYDFAQPQTQVCVHSLFPHFGYSPCWYVNRHTDKRIDI